MKNDYEVQGDIAFIILNHSKEGMVKAKINLSDLEKVASFSGLWNLSEYTKGRYYVAGFIRKNGKVTKHYLHRWISGEIPEGILIDHINGDRLDNTRDNLRLANKSQNAQNLVHLLSTNTSGHKNVTWDSSCNMWKVQLKVGGKMVHQRYFKDLEAAAEDAKLARMKHHPYSQELRKNG